MDSPEKPHVVPLTDAALKLLEAARERYGSKGLICPGMRRGKPISDVSLAKAIARRTDVKATTHGFRREENRNRINSPRLASA